MVKNDLMKIIVSIIIGLLFQLFRIIQTKDIRSKTNDDLLNILEPKFIVPVENKTAAIGKEAIFSCSVSNIGKYRVGWLRASDKMIISIHTRTVIQNDRIVVKYEPMTKVINKEIFAYNNEKEQMSAFDGAMNGTWILIIRQLKETDRGCYMCQVNTNPMISQFGCLDILVSPDILNNETSTDISVIEGENATLICKATGRPTPRIYWKKEDGSPILLRPVLQNGMNFLPINIFNGSKLILNRIDRRQMGTYLCIASNDVHPAVSKRVTLSVNFIPNVQALNQLLGAPLGTDVILECFVEAHPNTVNYWCKNPCSMLLDRSKYIIREARNGYKVDMQLTIKKFHRTDVGSYSCISSNSLGKVEGISRLYGIGEFDGEHLVHDVHHIAVLSGVAEAAHDNSAESDFRLYSIKEKLRMSIFYILLILL